ncbi:hypothetical protein [Bradyrhizobium sp. ARR65]|uniref:hypothetical protein n=1 Tax=Bradyrhizobium sp. ARR65 TaxID=1040989 RepID=UPI0012FBE1B8|nr:hypothetical protein [Bradyrhizobium sp. ARR65]
MHQIRFQVSDSAAARLIPLNLHGPDVAQLFDILTKHRAPPKCQFHAFAEYVAKTEMHGSDDHPLYEWTKTAIENPAKKERHLRSFALYVDGHKVYTKEIADELEASLRPLRVGAVARA